MIITTTLVCVLFDPTCFLTVQISGKVNVSRGRPVVRTRADFRVPACVNKLYRRRPAVAPMCSTDNRHTRVHTSAASY